MTLALPKLSDINPMEMAPTAASIAVATLGGLAMGGAVGGVVGLTASVFDEYLIKNGMQTEHNVTSTLFWSSFSIYPFCTSFMPEVPAVVNGVISLAAAYGITRNSADFLDFKDRLHIPLGSAALLNQFFKESSLLTMDGQLKIYNALREDPYEGLVLLKQDIEELFQNPMIRGASLVVLTTLLQIRLERWLLQALGGYAGVPFIVKLVGDYVPKHLCVEGLSSLPRPFVLEGLKILFFLSAQQIVRVVSSLVKRQIAMDMLDDFMAEASKLLLSGDNGQKLTSEEDGQEIVSYVYNDIGTLLNSFYLLDDTFSNTTRAIDALSDLSTLTPALMTPYLLTLPAIHSFYKNMSERVKKITEESQINQMKLWGLSGLVITKLQQIKLRDAEPYFETKLEQLATRTSVLTQASTANQFLMHQLSSIIRLVHSLSDIFFTGYYVLSGLLAFEKLALFNTRVDQFFTFLTGGLKFNLDSTDMTQSKLRLERFFSIIQTPSHQNLVRVSNEDNCIKVQDYELTLDKQPILKIDQLDFEMGKTYAVTGPSGCGKTTFLIDLKVGLFGSCSSSGEISLPQVNGKTASMLFLDQELFLPPDATLLECILFPKPIESFSESELANAREQVLSLFEELNIHMTSEDQESIHLSTRLDSTEFKLSGGQQKKVGFIQAILANPDILILDETFVGLDHSSLAKCQQAVKKYLPDSLIIVVDHHAKENNSSGFYDSRVDFGNGGAKLLSF